ncbi:MAG TPA: enoyl-CoA hydratase/isomerase family protein [Methylomirabilota bacterium]|nr:enoyl-CoA hydratase/isomerase family protein [Methylomirabilota bacterium]
MGGNEQTRWWTEDGVGYIVLDNPPMNVLSAENRRGMLEALAEFRRDDVRAAVITGAGDRAFCGGADLKEEQHLTEDTVDTFLERGQEVNRALREWDRPVIGAINGWTMGGGLVLALWCDLRVASTRAKFGAVGVKVGLMASNVQLTRFFTEARARDALLTGRTIEAEEALRVGLVSSVVAPDALMAEATAWAQAIARRDPALVARLKHAVNHALDGARDPARAPAVAAAGR